MESQPLPERDSFSGTFRPDNTIIDVTAEKDKRGGSPPHGGGGGGGPVGEDGGEAGVEQPGAGNGEAGDGEDQRSEEGQLCQGVVCIWRSGGSLLSPCQYRITAQL